VAIQRWTSEQPLELRCGLSLPVLEQGYACAGQLSAAADNAVLLFHGLSGSPEFCSQCGSGEPGWWEALVGPGKALDTRRFFVICVNALGGCHGSTGPHSLHPDGGVYGSRFPPLRLADMVEAQQRLLQHLGIRRLRAVVGGCLGGALALQWGAQYPQTAGLIVAIAATPRTTPLSLAFFEVLRQSIRAHPEFGDGNYAEPWPTRPMGLAAQVGMLMWMSPQVMEQRFGRRPGEVRDFAIQEFLQQLGEGPRVPFDARTLLVLTEALDHFDLYAEDLTQTRARYELFSYTQDLRYPSADLEQLNQHLLGLGRSSRHRILDSAYGHGGFLLEPQGLAGPLQEVFHGLD
jgi:homoserine O-acetyltransferase/O-succinyltransferase